MKEAVYEDMVEAFFYVKRQKNKTTRDFLRCQSLLPKMENLIFEHVSILINTEIHFQKKYN